VRQALLPVVGEELPPLRDRVDVVGESERHDVGFEPVDHRARLLRRSAVDCWISIFWPDSFCQYAANARLKSA
jgi:hypothetical protein